MIHVLPVWQQGIFGSSVRVRVNDNGVDASHDEFGDRFDEFASCDLFLPDPNATSNYHGTAVASILGAEANNDECSAGIAPNVTISACNIFAMTNTYNGGSFLANKVQEFDISQNSFGYPACGTGRRRRNLQPKDNPCPFTYSDTTNTNNPCTVCDFDSAPKSAKCQNAIVRHCRLNYEKDVSACLQFLDLILPGDGECEYNTLSPPEQKALAKGIMEGRDGKGIIYIFASGNSYYYGDDTNFKGYTNSRYDTIC
jgi:subtilisin family serine protease